MSHRLGFQKLWIILSLTKSASPGVLLLCHRRTGLEPDFPVRLGWVPVPPIPGFEGFPWISPQPGPSKPKDQRVAQQMQPNVQRMNPPPSPPPPPPRVLASHTPRAGAARCVRHPPRQFCPVSSSPRRSIHHAGHITIWSETCSPGRVSATAPPRSCSTFPPCPLIFTSIEC